MLHFLKFLRCDAIFSLVLQISLHFCKSKFFQEFFTRIIVPNTLDNAVSYHLIFKFMILASSQYNNICINGISSFFVSFIKSVSFVYLIGFITSPIFSLSSAFWKNKRFTSLLSEDLQSLLENSDSSNTKKFVEAAMRVHDQYRPTKELDSARLLQKIYIKQS